MNSIEVCFSPKLFNQYSIKNKIVVVVDILRATTIITTMLESGAKRIIPVKDLEEAKEYKENGFLVVAERDGKKVDFADFDNSPYSFIKEKVSGKTLVYSTTNGTNTINIAKESELLIMASFLNLSAVIGYLSKQEKDILILCSGWKGKFCIEDSLFAGALASELLKTKAFNTNCDSVISSIDLWNLAKQDFGTFIKKIFQYKRLVALGLESIIDYCFQRDVSTVIPFLKDDYIVDLKSLT